MVAATETATDRAAAERFIQEVRAKNHAFYATDRGQGALKDLQQTFPHPWLYVGELLQNAVDAGAKRIRLAISEDTRSLVVEHDGTPFDAGHVEALCVRGMSKKGAGTVGFMGIGFKAVFQSYECVDVASGPWRFRFCVKEIVGEFGDRQREWLGCVLPEYRSDIDAPSTGMTCRFVLRDRLDRLGPIEEDVTKVVSVDLLVLALLARRGVQEIEWKGQRWVLGQAEQTIDERTTKVTLTAHHDGNGDSRQWILFSSKYQPSRPAIARFLEHRQIQPRPEERESVYAEAQRERCVEVFCPLDNEGFPDPPRRGQAYALLPTGVAIPLGLHVQADWLLVTSRREIMEVETNEWHREILAHLAGLLGAYLHWVTSLREVPERRLAEAFAVLPDWSETEGAFATYLHNAEFRQALRARLASLAFLPVRADDGIRFATPTDAKLLPSALRVFDDARLLPWALLGEHIISTSLLGARALSGLEGLDLLQPLVVDDLAGRWNAATVGSWRSDLEDRGAEAHLKLLRALASLDDNPAWRDAPLRCLPSSDGTWIDRQHAVGLPAEWDSVPEKDPALRSWLEPFIAPSENRLDWTFDRSLRRDTPAQQYIAGIKRHKLEEVLGVWWISLPASPNDEAVAQILDATCWVLSKRRQQPGLVSRVLCDAPLGKVLVSFADAVLAEPYASAARRRFFKEYPAVSALYLHHAPGVSDADWRSFFEAASDALKGPLRLTESVKDLSRGQLARALPGYDVPGTKSWRITARWRGVSFSSDNYLLVNASLPSTLQTVLTGTVSFDDAQGAAQWLHEARQELPGKKAVRVVYVPYNSSSPYAAITNVAASWVGVLNEASWLYDTNGNGPYAPSQVLARVDIARPDVSVARLPEELATTLEACGITFGTSIPEVAAIERLRREGPSTDVARLCELLEQAIDASKDQADHRAELLVLLRTVALVPLPLGARPIDGVARIGADRFVLRSVRGAELGGWLIPIDALTRGLSEDDDYPRLVRLLTSVQDLPDTPTWEQALALLQWVWQARPDAELVRRTLPRAYRIIAEEFGADPTREGAWEKACAHAIVYVASRKWVSVRSDQLFLDDLGDDRLKGIVDGLLLATPGHLGETAAEQHRVAALLGVRFLSARFQVTLQTEGEQPLPAHWSTAFSAIVDLLQSYAREDQGADEPTPRDPLAMTYYAQLRKVLIDNGVQGGIWSVHAARDEGYICLAGDPDDFAADLCRVLLQWAGLASRRDLDELAPTITQLIGWLDRPEKFARRFAVLGAQQGVTPAVPKTAPPEEQPTPGERQPPEAAVPPADAPGQPPPAPTPPPTGGSPKTGAPPIEPEAEDTTGDEETVPPASGGYTPENREGRLKALQKQQDQITKQMASLLGVGPVPDDPPTPGADEGEEHPGKFGTDVLYRAAVVEYERAAGRFAETKDAKQPGYDIDSFDRPLDDPQRLLIRRIEVKGHGCPWQDDDTVELSDRQFFDAVATKAEHAVGDDFDFWLYVVERLPDGELQVLALRNPARRAAKFEFRGGTWRAFAEGHSPEDNC